MSEAKNLMTPSEIAAFLRRLNAWRRGDEYVPMPDPREIGEVIDAAAVMLESMDCAARQDAIATRAVDYLNRVDALVIEIEARAARGREQVRTASCVEHDVCADAATKPEAGTCP